MKNPLLTLLRDKSSLPGNIRSAIVNLLDEDDRYAADEIVALSDELLKTLGALCFQTYMFQEKQNNTYNNFLTDLITGAQDYNAGPIYRWGANMILPLESEFPQKLKEHLWETDNNRQVLNKDLSHFASFRNQVMHGFFVLPPETSMAEADRLGKIINSLFDSGLLNMDMISKELSSVYPFFIQNGAELTHRDHFTLTDEEMKTLTACHDLTDSVQQILLERSGEYFTKKKKLFESDNTCNPNGLIEAATDYIHTNDRGTLFFTHTWNGSSKNELTGVYEKVKHNEFDLPIPFFLTKAGNNFTWKYILNTINKEICDKCGLPYEGKDPQKELIKIRPKHNGKIILFVENIHINLFHPAHLLQLTDFFYDNKIQLICAGINYAFIRKFVNRILEQDACGIPEMKELEILIENYLNFKGPFADVDNEREYHKQLMVIINDLISQLKSGPVTLRFFADANNYPVEAVKEAFNIVEPFVKLEKGDFKVDVPDPIWEYPEVPTESTPIFLHAGRRDFKLEYKHVTARLI